MQRFIPVLALASGMCGIAYELIYARLLTTYLGDMFHVGAAILASFLLGIALGSFVAHYWVRVLWLIECLIGAYAAGVAFCFSVFSLQIQETWLPATSGNPSVVVALVFGALITPALLVGFSVPIFAIYRRHYSPPTARRAAFREVYGLYNLGAAACVLLIEFFVLRATGIVGALYTVALVNVCTGAVLLRIPPPPSDLADEESVTRIASGLPFSLGALFIASAVSGVYTLFVYKLTETLFGPFHENFALLLSLALLGIATGTAVAHRHPRPLSRWLLGSSALVSLSFVALAPLIYAWAALNGTLGVAGWLSTTLKALILVALTGIPFGAFGGTVPCLLAELRWRKSAAGTALGVSGLGNCAGYLIMVLWLYSALPERAVAFVISGLLLGAGFALAYVQGERRPPWIPGIALLALFVAWPSNLLHFAYDDYRSLEALREARRTYTDHRVHRRFDSQLALLYDENGSEVLVINGYKSVVSSAGGHTNLRELLYGITPAVYSAGLDHALVLGVGTGITAGATASVYHRTTAVEINPSVLDLLPHFREHNLGLHENPRVHLVLDDGLNALLHGREPYDAIVNTVTTPLYFSSSKLYTIDFFRIVSRRLAPGGVYAMWFDSRVTAEGASIIFRTLKEVFVDCHITFLTKNYSQFLCGNEPLRARDPNSVDWSEELRARFRVGGFGMDIPEILAALLFSRHDLFLREWDAPANTFDRPVLEFLMASRALTVAGRQRFSPYAMVGVEYQSSPFHEGPIAGRELAARLYATRVLGGMKLTWWREKFRDPSNQEALAWVVDRMLAYRPWGAPILTEAERLMLAESLLGTGDLDRAWRLVGEHRPSPDQGGPFAILEAELRMARGNPVPDELVGRLYALGPVHPRAREMLARISASRGDYRAALRHLEFLTGIGPRTGTAVELERKVRRVLEETGAS